MTPERVLITTRRVMLTPWVWGAADCCTSACDVFAELWGVDAMALLRGRYRTAGGAARQIARLGGWLEMCEGLAEAAGLIASDGSPGDLGLSRANTSVGAGALGGQCLMICISAGAWAGKTENGFAMRADVEKAWRV